MKTKIIIVSTLATLALVGCGGNNEPRASAGTAKYWTQISSQKDAVVVDGNKGNAMVLVK